MSRSLLRRTALATAAAVLATGSLVLTSTAAQAAPGKGGAKTMEWMR